ncbi:outer membrane lipoprotein chaperone LolA [Roseateles koreensis]|uniref:Outer-membrane lipoprotein carrier protein n=1 Tax=Roseateles koreensis TaxID=2987526 RepID=A0ABT5KSN9_9BURK|nr:outer membrane lipoprotein chaperone LolA [Roseateles koreensis]
MKHRIKSAVFVLGLLGLAALAQADALVALKDFVRDVKSGRTDFTQTVSSPDGLRKKISFGTFEFQRPNQFRFAYTKPFEQLIVGDGQKVWIYDPDLKQASSRRMSQVLGATPAALLAGASLERDFTLKPLAPEGGLEWVLATPRQADGSVQSLKVGFKGASLAALEVVDGFGQRSRLDFAGFVSNQAIAAERFRFVPPAGADLIEQ